MLVERRFTLDTNVLVYAADADAALRRRRARHVLRRATLADCVLTVQALAEFYRVATRKRLVEASRARAIVEQWRRVFPVLGATANELEAAMAAVDEASLSFWDAMLWATARRAGCAVILTEDFQDGRRIGGVRFLNPFRARNDADLAALLGA